MNKIINYDIFKLNMSVPAFFNSNLKDAYKNDKITYITFIQSDLLENIVDLNNFIESYINFIKEWSLPYCFFPYYTYFNRILPNSLAIPNPKFELSIDETKKIHIITSPAIGFLILDLSKLKKINFMFNESYTELFYLQDLIQKCYEQKLWISNCCFLDRYESWKDLKQNIVGKFLLNSEKFNKEKTEYNKLNFSYHTSQEFFKVFKEKYKL